MAPIPTLAETAAALAALRGFIGREQLLCLAQLCHGEERAEFRESIVALAERVRLMPQTYGNQGVDRLDVVAHLHYFTPSADFYITEKDKGSPDDSPEDYQSQAFGYADLGFGAEGGYISLPEILAAGAELDLHWDPTPVREVLK
jgi:hypothetical protein